jgi:inhibitor of cysteine peptidase
MLRATTAAVVALLVASAPAGARKLTLHAKDDGRTVRLHRGDRVLIVLDENPTTGYAWKLTRRPARAIARVTSSRYAADPVAPGIVGSGGTRTIRVRAVGRGRTRLALTYVAAGHRPAGDRFRLALRVR